MPTATLTNQNSTLFDPAMARRATTLRERAASLRTDATAFPAPAAAAFLRRAAELELAAWALDARAGVRDEDLAAAA